MSSKSQSLLSPLGFIIGFLALIGGVMAAPSMMKVFQLQYLLPLNIHVRLLEIHNDKDFWACTLFATALVLLYVLLNLIAWIIASDTSIDLDPKRDNIHISTFENGKLYEGSSQQVQRAIERDRRLYILKTFGVSLLRKRILKAYGVDESRTFKRGSQWPKEPQRWDSIDRLHFEDGHGIEYQYPKKKNL